ncbi:MAG: SAM-dependent methyltransferase [Flavobacteriaceae bacterium]|nr:SAM-dependent methyltransferase [Flavobacteriaceae bacterium]
MYLKKSSILTKDGSSTLRIDSLNESYHSLHGAVTESEFVYLDNGLRFWQKSHSAPKASVLEIGYGTGLLAFLSFLNQLNNKMEIDYTSLEAYPLKIKDLERLNYNSFFESNQHQSFLDFSKLPWNNINQIIPKYSILKHNIFFEDFKSEKLYDIIYYDAFGFHAQPNLWEIEWMKKCFDLLNNGGLWISFCAKGSVRRGLQKVGFDVERLPGPPGKREMLRAIKP